MKKEYDFSKAERGKFYQKDAVFNLPIYLDNDNLLFVQDIANHKNMDISSVVNELIRADQKNHTNRQTII